MEREMIDSGIEWIGAIPHSWHVLPAQRCFVEIKRKNSDGAIQKALKFKFGEIIPKHNFDAEFDDYVAEAITAYTVVEPGTVMINGLNLNYDFKTQRTGLVKETGVITSAYLALWPNCHLILAEYATYLFKGYETRMALHNMGSGIRLTLGFKEFKKQPILLPSLTEQRSIADFLDHECAEIDRVVAETEKSIEEYKKLKQSVITEAVTKGVRGDRPMKDSGIEWIGEIPEGIDISRVGLHYNIVLGKMLCSTPFDETYSLEPYFCAADVHFSGIFDGERKQMWFSPIEKDQYLVCIGDLLVVEGGAGAGGCGIVESLPVPTYIQNSIMCVRTKGIASVRYLRYLIECFVKQGYVDVVCNKATIPHFTKDKLATVPFILFDQQEQHEIADFLDEQCAKIGHLIQEKQQLLAELSAYKKSLIYEYVTGKTEVPVCQ